MTRRLQQCCYDLPKKNVVLFSQSNVCRHNICEVVWCLPLLLLLLFLFSQGLAEVNVSLYMFSSINVVVYSVCSHCTLQASLVKFILYVRLLLFNLISFIFSCMTCMKIIGKTGTNTIDIVKMKINVVLNACHNNY